MQRAFTPLPAFGMEPATSFQQQVQPQPRAVRPDDPAVEVMTDFRQVRALTVPPEMTMEYARARMRANRVHLLLVVDARNDVLGLITSTDTDGEKPMRVVHQRGIRHDEISVADVMTPRSRLEVLDMDDVMHARVGHVVATLKAVGRQHAMVVDRDAQGRPQVRGLFAASQLARQLGTPVETSEVARSFADLEEMLTH